MGAPDTWSVGVARLSWKYNQQKPPMEKVATANHQEKAGRSKGRGQKASQSLHTPQGHSKDKGPARPENDQERTARACERAQTKRTPEKVQDDMMTCAGIAKKRCSSDQKTKSSTCPRTDTGTDNYVNMYYKYVQMQANTSATAHGASSRSIFLYLR